MVDEINKTRKGKDDQLKEYITKAKKVGAVKVDRPGGEFFVVALHQRHTEPPGPFDGEGKLLELPVARAAYSDRTAWLMAVLSKLAYERHEDSDDKILALNSTLSEAGLVLVATFDNQESGTQAFLARNPDNFNVLVFRGTEKDGKDIWTDIKARYYDTPEGKAHKGFAMAYESIRRDIENELTILRDNKKAEQLFVAGHSLGGALATVATQNLEEKFLVSACYTFGCPRVGNAEWSDKLKTPVYRVVNGADGVPLVPGGVVMRWVLTSICHLPFLTWTEGFVNRLVEKGYVGFQHAGDLRFLQGDTEAPHLKIGSAGFWARLRHITYGRIVNAIKRHNPKALTAFFTDHAIAGYVAKLRKIAEDRN